MDDTVAREPVPVRSGWPAETRWKTNRAPPPWSAADAERPRAGDADWHPSQSSGIKCLAEAKKCEELAN